MLTLNDLFQGFRQPEVIRALAAKITELAKDLPEPLRVMEVCGGHTHTIMKYGLHQLLPASIEFVHGPGCPVCIMPKERIDQAIERTRAFFESLEVPTRLSAYQLDASAIDPLIAQLEKHGMVKLGEKQDISLEVSRQILQTAL